MDGTNKETDWHKITQNDEYLQLSINRLNQPILKWANQISEMLPKKPLTVNEIGCNVGHFYRAIKDKNMTYKGYDISKTYLDVATKNFGNFFHQLDITKQIPETADVTVISATLEHLENFEDALNNIFLSTKKRVILRTFIGFTNKISYFSKSDSHKPYIVRQFNTKALNPNKLAIKLIKDAATNSKPYKIGNFKRKIQIIDFKLSNIDD
jgi:SAM-dependent methyltransferase